MEFGILGPLLATHDGQAVPIRGRHKPRLLALLLIEAPRAVTMTSLVDELWVDPPDTARRQVQNAMSSLRRELTAVTGTEVIERVADGYRIGAGERDTKRFAAHSSRGRDALRDNDPVTALAEFDAGLALWRGPACAGLAGSGIEAAAGRLDESRLAAREDRFDAMIALDRSAESVGELYELTAAYPHRQRLAGQLMRALHGSGRTSEALEAFAELRARLADDLGIDPERRLRDLHAAILREDDEVSAAPEPVASTPPPTDEPAVPLPAQLPADIAEFTGRAHQMSTLNSLAQRGGAALLTTLSGTGGIGKTALAVHWGHQNVHRFPDGQLYVNLRGYDTGEPVAAKTVLDRFLSAVGYPADRIPADPDEAAAAYRSMLADKRMLILLDNARDVNQIRPLLPGGAGNVVLVTSRDRLASLVVRESARPLYLDILSGTESRALLSDMVGRDRATSEPEALDRIIALCGRLPLALRIAGAQLAAEPETDLAEFANRLAGPDRIDTLAVDGDSSADIAASFALSLRSLDDATTDLFVRLGLVPGDDVPTGLAEAITGLPEPAARKALRRLESACLIQQYRKGRYRMHDLVRDFAHREADRLLTEEQHDAVAEAVLDWYKLHYTTLTADDFANLLIVADTYTGRGTEWKLTVALGFPDFTGFDGYQVLDRILAIQRRVAPDNADGRRWVHTSLAYIHYRMGEFDLAIEAQRQVVEACRPLGDFDLVAALSNLGIRLMNAGQHVEAEHVLREALSVTITDPDRVHARFITMANLGTLLRLLGSLAEAEELLVTSAELKKQHRLDWDLSRHHADLAMLYSDTGRYSEAEAILDLPTGGTGANQHHGVTDFERARLLLYLHRDPAAAESRFRELREIAYRDGQNRYANEADLALIEVYLATGRHPDAYRVLAELETTDMSNTSTHFRSALFLLRAITDLRTGEHASAVEFGRQAVDGYAAMPYPRNHGLSLLVVAEALDAMREVDASRAARDEARELFARLGFDKDTLDEGLPNPHP